MTLPVLADILIASITDKVLIPSFPEQTGASFPIIIDKKLCNWSNRDSLFGSLVCVVDRLTQHQSQLFSFTNPF